MKTYEVNGWTKTAEEYIFEKGISGGGLDFFAHDRFSGNTVKDLIEVLKLFVWCEDEDILFDSCGESGRIDIQRMEDANGERALKSEISKWKKGELRLWLATYTFYVKQVERKTVALTPLLKD